VVNCFARRAENIVLHKMVLQQGQGQGHMVLVEAGSNNHSNIMMVRERVEEA
jgi:hypothetical protein